MRRSCEQLRRNFSKKRALGAGLLTALPQALTVFAEYEHMALGLIMMLVMIFLPSGLLPSLARQFRRGG